MSEILRLVRAGIRIFCQEERSQLRNKERALALLRTKLYELELEKQRSAISAQRKSQVQIPATSRSLLASFFVPFLSPFPPPPFFKQ
jgi:protein subunit release factor A